MSPHDTILHYFSLFISISSVADIPPWHHLTQWARNELCWWEFFIPPLRAPNIISPASYSATFTNALLWDQTTVPFLTVEYNSLEALPVYQAIIVSYSFCPSYSEDVSLTPHPQCAHFLPNLFIHIPRFTITHSVVCRDLWMPRANSCEILDWMPTPIVVIQYYLCIWCPLPYRDRWMSGATATFGPQPFCTPLHTVVRVGYSMSVPIKVIDCHLKSQGWLGRTSRSASSSVRERVQTWSC